jgi:hypothetical protein
MFSTRMRAFLTERSGRFPKDHSLPRVTIHRFMPFQALRGLRFVTAADTSEELFCQFGFDGSQPNLNSSALGKMAITRNRRGALRVSLGAVL